uniref:Uncharacterized protein n=1 Tax=uncultured Thiotrichaceae bacterium TaxID=298394 RepID=A0A6S6U397_9GAMM|nr:MAG: Unknown protein [uncultured Thiotrichaceae bacterium]
MQTYFDNHKELSLSEQQLAYVEQLNTARCLLDSLVMYRSELGETGKKLEYLFRLLDIEGVLDAPYSTCVH